MIDLIVCRRDETSVAVDMPMLPLLVEELRNIAADRMRVITHDGIITRRIPKLVP